MSGDPRSFSKLCKEKGFQKTNNIYRCYFRTYGDGLLQLITICWSRAARRHICFGNYSMYGKFCSYTAYNGKACLPYGAFTTETFAALHHLSPPKTIEEDYLFMEQYGIPYLDSTQTQRDFIAEEALLASAHRYGFSTLEYNVCGAFLHEGEDRKAWDHVAQYLARNADAFYDNNRKAIEEDCAEEVLSAIKKWITDTKDQRACYSAIIRSYPHNREPIKEYIERWYQINTEIVKILACGNKGLQAQGMAPWPDLESF